MVQAQKYNEATNLTTYAMLHSANYGDVESLLSEVKAGLFDASLRR